MTKVALLLTAIAATLLFALPANAQRVFVSGSGSDSNPCTFPQPCRTFQQAFNTVAANGEIDVLDPAGYGPVTITHGISIQAHGFGGITVTMTDATAVAVNAGASDAITLNGLLIDGSNAGLDGVVVHSAGSVQIVNCVVRHFGNGITYAPTNSPSNLAVSNTVLSDNSGPGINASPSTAGTPVTLSGVTANNNGTTGVYNNGAWVMIADSVLSNNSTGLGNNNGTSWLAKSTVSGNGTGVAVFAGRVDSYGDNYINSNGTDVNGTLSSDATQ